MATAGHHFDMYQVDNPRFWVEVHGKWNFANGLRCRIPHGEKLQVTGWKDTNRDGTRDFAYVIWMKERGSTLEWIDPLSKQACANTRKRRGWVSVEKIEFVDDNVNWRQWTAGR